MMFQRLINFTVFITFVSCEILCFSNYGISEGILLNFIFALFLACIVKIHIEGKQIKKIVAVERKILLAREAEYREAKMLYNKHRILDEF